MRRYIFRQPMMTALGCSLALVLANPAFGQNQQQPPAGAQQGPRPALDLKAHDIRTDRAAVSASSLTITSLDVSVKIVGGLAETTLTAQFSNPNNNVLEGDFTLDLPREAYVTGFGLDVNGVMIDGVLQAKAKAAEAYEENLRRGVDPGLGEINSANQFRTRIFPINPRSSRTVKISYVSALDATGAYVLPLTTAGAVGQVKVQITNEGNANPRVSVPTGLRASQGANNNGVQDGYGQTIARYEGQNIALRGDLKMTGIGRDDGVSISVARNGDRYFTFLAPQAPIASSKPNIVRVYWDGSRSRRDDDLAKEITLLERYVASVAPARLDVIVFADGQPRTISFTRDNMTTLGNQLRGLRYQGASRFGGLERAGAGDADMCLLFSDGQLTMGAFAVGTWPCRVMTISTSNNARADILGGIAEANRGTFVDLKSATLESALSALQSRGPDLRTLKDDSGAAVDFSASPTPTGQFRIIGPMPDSQTLSVQTYGAPRSLNLTAAPSSGHNGAATFWGISQIKRLSATDNPDTDKLLAAVRRYGVATPDYSYVVLETVEDYARNDIAPSPSAGKDFLSQYQTRRTQIEAQQRAEKEARFTAILTRWTEQKTWWKTRFAPAPQQSRPNNSNNSSARIDAASAPRDVPPPQPSMVPPPPPPPAPPPQVVERSARLAPAAAPGARDRAVQQEIAVTGSIAQPATSQPQGSAPAPTATISVTSAPWNPDRPYLRPLAAVKKGETAAFEAIYREQEARNGNTPAFYFDMAEWAFRNGFEAQAAAIGANALELPSTSVDTKIILASRLVRYGAFDQAIWLNERILQATPNKPQALRNLALSVAAAADAKASQPAARADTVAAYERALGLLMKIVLTPNNGDYDGIELIALMEANRLVPKLKALGVSDARLAELIDPRLASLLSVDIRVTLEWNTDKTDMDLWVDEPGGERAIYSNPRTAIGGRLSNDMTRGYGPEEYLLNVAPNGTYVVRSNAFAADRLDPNGPSSLTVKLYRNWGRANEQVESFVVELDRQTKDTVEVGRFIKGPAPSNAN
jgi:Vault protein inter-alpha-trypsin domain